MQTATQVEGFHTGNGVLAKFSDWINVRTIFFWGVMGLLAYLTLGPLLFLLWDSFHPGWEIGDQVAFTFSSYVKVFGDQKFIEMFWNTAIFGVGATTLAVGLGSFFAWLVERTNMPFRNVTYALLFAPVAIPGLVFAISYILLLSPDIGVLNKLLMGVLGLEEAPLNIYSMTGLIFVEGIRLTPGSFLMMAAVLKSMDPFSRRGGLHNRSRGLAHLPSDHGSADASRHFSRLHLLLYYRHRIIRSPGDHRSAHRHAATDN